MTARELIKNLIDLPEELKDIPIEIVTQVSKLEEDYIAREDKYLNAIAFNEDKKEVLLFSKDDFDLFMENTR